MKQTINLNRHIASSNLDGNKISKIKRLTFIILPLAFILCLISCTEKPPTDLDGTGILHLKVMWDSTGLDTLTFQVPLRGAKVLLTSEYGMKIFYTDNKGELLVENLPITTYNVSVRKERPDNPNAMLIGNVKNIFVKPGVLVSDTILTEEVSATGIAINEIYSAGPINNIFYIYDVFIELYNSTDSIKYLDGMIVMRVSGNSTGKGPGADEDDDGDIDGVTYAFKFPGNPGEKNCPIKPRQFVVLATKAVDHRTMVSTSFDLSNADWEFFNQYSTTDTDNPNVPNLLNIRPDRTVDFLIGLTGDVIVISDGTDSTWQDGINITTIVDAVEYQSNPHPVSKKTLDSRVDKGYVLSPPRYSGQSIQRKEPGLDTNDGTIDFEILPRATPGYQK